MQQFRPRDYKVYLQDIAHAGIGGQSLFKDDGMLPVVTEGIRVHGLCADPAQHLMELHLALMDEVPRAEKTRFRTRLAISLPANSEIVQVFILPAHNALEHVVQCGQR